MIRLIIFILIFALFLGFIVLNLDNKSDVSLGFKTFAEIPVFLSSLVSFAVGLVFSVPLAFSFSRRKKVKNLNDSPVVPEALEARNSRLPFRKKALKDKAPLKNALPPEQDHIKKEDSPYGID
jgi:uncharacterized integral membrane protein